MKKAAVISGGGSWGAFTAGRLFSLNKSYDIVIGCSTGALMAPLIALGEYKRLYEAYTSITTKDIFNVNPFKSNGNIKILNALWRIIRGKDTWGETVPFKQTIKNSSQNQIIIEY